MTDRRRVTAQLHAEGILANHKKVMRLMGAGANRARRRFVVTTDSDHNGPIFPNLAKDVLPTGPNELWVADITYIAIATGFVYLAAILDAWSRRVVGYASGRRIDARLELAALRAAIGTRQPPEGWHELAHQALERGYARLLRLHEVGGNDVAVEGAGLILGHPDAHEVATDLMSLGEPMQRLAGKILLLPR